MIKRLALRLLGPSNIATVWSGFGGVCEFNTRGDPVVLYDQLADRWLISQFAGVSIPTDECVAISATADATGSYHRYDFHLGSNFFDYPHLSVWPDAYYMSMNVFNSTGTSFLGPQPFAFDRAKMLAGLPATFVTTGITNGPLEETYLPADLDGSNLPPPGAPGVFVEFPSGGNVSRLPLRRRFCDACEFVVHAIQYSARGGIHHVVSVYSIMRATVRNDFETRRHRRSTDVPAHVSQFRHARISRR